MYKKLQTNNQIHDFDLLIYDKIDKSNPIDNDYTNLHLLGKIEYMVIVFLNEEGNE